MSEWRKDPPDYPAGTVVQLLIYSVSTRKMGIATLTTGEDGFQDFRGYGGPRRLFPAEWRWMPLPPPPTE
jgi:hypothetical protein